MSVNTLRQLSPFVRLAHDYQCPSGWNLDRRRINDHALLYFKRGYGRFFIGKNAFLVSPGSLFVIRPDVIHSFRRSDPGPLHMLNLHFDLVERAGCERIHHSRSLVAPNPRRRLEQFSTDPKSASYLPWHMKIDQEAAYERLFHVILARFSLHDPTNRLALKGACLDLLSFLFRQVRAQAVSSRLLHHLPQLERAAHFMRTTLNRSLTLTEVARKAELSRSYFATCFTAYYRVSPAKFHLRQRIEKSAVELIFSSRSVKEVATAFGFQTVHHFSRRFTQLTGMPPAAYRLAYGSPLGQSN